MMSSRKIVLSFPRPLFASLSNNVVAPSTQIRPFAASTKVKKKKKKSSADTESTSDRDLKLMLAALDAPVKKEPPISEEEKARRYQVGRNYVIGSFNRHNDFMHDLACKIQLKKHAVNMLPKQSKLKEEAMKIDDSAPPPWKHVPVWTPPIKDFDMEKFIKEDDD